jgi:hypothetical protein
MPRSSKPTREHPEVDSSNQITISNESSTFISSLDPLQEKCPKKFPIERDYSISCFLVKIALLLSLTVAVKAVEQACSEA